MSQQGVAPVNIKVQGISDRLKPTNLKQLRSYLGAVNQFNKFIPNLATICFPFRTLLKKDTIWEWKNEQEKAFEQVNNEIKKVTELNHFKRDCLLRIICDASKSGLGAVLQQEEKGEWKPLSFASRFLTELEAKYSIKELELLAIVWSVEYFRNYVYGVKFKIKPDHKALATVLKGHKGNKTYSSRLTRWVGRLLPFNFEIIHGTGRNLGIADFLSRNPTEQNKSTKKAKTLWDEWFTVNIVSEMKNNLLTNQNAIRGEQQPIKIESDTAEQKGESANNDAAATLKQTIKNTLTDITNDTAGTMSKNDEQKQLQELANKPPVKHPFKLALVDKSSKTPRKSSIQKIGENNLAGTYESDQTLQTVIQSNNSTQRNSRNYQKCGKTDSRTSASTRMTSST